MKTSLARCSIRRVSPPRHVIVCGAGVVGASVAYFLARRGVAVTVVERSGVACAASGRAGGFLPLDWCDGSPLGPLARRSFALHAELAKELATDYGYLRMDTFMLAARETGSLAGGHRVGAPRWLDGSGIVTATLGSTGTTAQVTPARFTAARGRGLRGRDGRPRAAARFTGGGRGERRRLRGPGAGRRPRLEGAGRRADRPSPGLLSARNRRRTSADRSRAGPARRVRRDRPPAAGDAQPTRHRS